VTSENSSPRSISRQYRTVRRDPDFRDFLKILPSQQSRSARYYILHPQAVYRTQQKDWGVRLITPHLFPHALWHVLVVDFAGDYRLVDAAKPYAGRLKLVRGHSEGAGVRAYWCVPMDWWLGRRPTVSLIMTARRPLQSTG
jgi:hypothetical protein